MQLLVCIKYKYFIFLQQYFLVYYIVCMGLRMGMTLNIIEKRFALDWTA